LNLSKYAYFSLSAIFVLVAGFFITTFAFSAMGLLAGLISLFGFMLIFFGVLILFIMVHAPVENFYDAVKQQGKMLPKLIIIKDKKHPDIEWFRENGELVMTDKGGLFYYGHPFIQPRKLLIINSLNSDEISSPFIVIEAPVQFKDSGLYVETKHPLIVAGKPSGYEDLIQMIGAGDTISKGAENVRKALSGNPTFIKEKTDKMSLSEFEKDKF